MEVFVEKPILYEIHEYEPSWTDKMDLSSISNVLNLKMSSSIFHRVKNIFVSSSPGTNISTEKNEAKKKLLTSMFRNRWSITLSTTGNYLFLLSQNTLFVRSTRSNFQRNLCQLKFKSKTNFRMEDHLLRISIDESLGAFVTGESRIIIFSLKRRGFVVNSSDDLFGRMMNYYNLRRNFCYFQNMCFLDDRKEMFVLFCNRLYLFDFEEEDENALYEYEDVNNEGKLMNFQLYDRKKMILVFKDEEGDLVLKILKIKEMKKKKVDHGYGDEVEEIKGLEKEEENVKKVLVNEKYCFVLYRGIVNVYTIYPNQVKKYKKLKLFYGETDSANRIANFGIFDSSNLSIFKESKEFLILNFQNDMNFLGDKTERFKGNINLTNYDEAKKQFFIVQNEVNYRRYQTEKLKKIKKIKEDREKEKKEINFVFRFFHGYLKGDSKVDEDEEEEVGDFIEVDKSEEEEETRIVTSTSKVLPDSMFYKYRLLKFKILSPEEKLVDLLHMKKYEEALELCRVYELDEDRIYKKRFNELNFEHGNDYYYNEKDIIENLFKMKEKSFNFVLNKALNANFVDATSYEVILDYAIQITNLQLHKIVNSGKKEDEYEEEEEGEDEDAESNVFLKIRYEKLELKDISNEEEKRILLKRRKLFKIRNRLYLFAEEESPNFRVEFKEFKTTNIYQYLTKLVVFKDFEKAFNILKNYVLKKYNFVRNRKKLKKLKKLKIMKDVILNIIDTANPSLYLELLPLYREEEGIYFNFLNKKGRRRRAADFSEILYYENKYGKEIEFEIEEFESVLSFYVEKCSRIIENTGLIEYALVILDYIIKDLRKNCKKEYRSLLKFNNDLRNLNVLVYKFPKYDNLELSFYLKLNNYRKFKLFLEEVNEKELVNNFNVYCLPFLNFVNQESELERILAKYFVDDLSKKDELRTCNMLFPLVVKNVELSRSYYSKLLKSMIYNSPKPSLKDLEGLNQILVADFGEESVVNDLKSFKILNRYKIVVNLRSFKNFDKKRVKELIQSILIQTNEDTDFEKLYLDLRNLYKFLKFGNFISLQYLTLEFLKYCFLNGKFTISSEIIRLYYTKSEERLVLSKKEKFYEEVEKILYLTTKELLNSILPVDHKYLKRSKDCVVLFKSQIKTKLLVGYIKENSRKWERELKIIKIFELMLDNFRSEIKNPLEIRLILKTRNKKREYFDVIEFLIMKNRLNHRKSFFKKIDILKEIYMTMIGKEDKEVYRNENNRIKLFLCEKSFNFEDYEICKRFCEEMIIGQYKKSYKMIFKLSALTVVTMRKRKYFLGFQKRMFFMKFAIANCSNFKELKSIIECYNLQVKESKKKIGLEPTLVDHLKVEKYNFNHDIDSEYLSNLFGFYFSLYSKEASAKNANYLLYVKLSENLRSIVNGKELSNRLKKFSKYLDFVSFFWGLLVYYHQKSKNLLVLGEIIKRFGIEKFLSESVVNIPSNDDLRKYFNIFMDKKRLLKCLLVSDTQIRKNWEVFFSDDSNRIGDIESMIFKNVNGDNMKMMIEIIEYCGILKAKNKSNRMIKSLIRHFFDESIFRGRKTLSKYYFEKILGDICNKSDMLVQFVCSTNDNVEEDEESKFIQLVLIVKDLKCYELLITKYYSLKKSIFSGEFSAKVEMKNVTLEIFGRFMDFMLENYSIFSVDLEREEKLNEENEDDEDDEDDDFGESFLNDLELEFDEKVSNVKVEKTKKENESEFFEFPPRVFIKLKFFLKRFVKFISFIDDQEFQKDIFVRFNKFLSNEIKEKEGSSFEKVKIFLIKNFLTLNNNGENEVESKNIMINSDLLRIIKNNDRLKMNFDEEEYSGLIDQNFKKDSDVWVSEFSKIVNNDVSNRTNHQLEALISILLIWKDGANEEEDPKLMELIEKVILKICFYVNKYNDDDEKEDKIFWLIENYLKVERFFGIEFEKNVIKKIEKIWYKSLFALNSNKVDVRELGIFILRKKDVKIFSSLSSSKSKKDKKLIFELISNSIIYGYSLTILESKCMMELIFEDNILKQQHCKIEKLFLSEIIMLSDLKHDESNVDLVVNYLCKVVFKIPNIFIHSRVNQNWILRKFFRFIDLDNKEDKLISEKVLKKLNL